MTYLLYIAEPRANGGLGSDRDVEFRKRLCLHTGVIFIIGIQKRHNPKIRYYSVYLRVAASANRHQILELIVLTVLINVVYDDVLGTCAYLTGLKSRIRAFVIALIVAHSIDEMMVFDALLITTATYTQRNTGVLSGSFLHSSRATNLFPARVAIKSFTGT